MKRLLALFAAFTALCACASAQDETWIGKNVGVCVNSAGEKVEQGK